MISALRLGNFKAFGATAEIPVRPITLLFGPNSAGKSSLIHGLVLGHEAVSSERLDIRQTKIGGDSIELGGFRRYAHRHAVEQRVTWGLGFEGAGSDWFAEHLGSSHLVTNVTFALPLDDTGRWYARAEPRPVSYQLRAGDEPVFDMSLSTGRLHLDELTGTLVRYVRRALERSSLRPEHLPDEHGLQLLFHLATVVEPTGLFPTNVSARAQVEGYEETQPVLMRVLQALLRRVHAAVGAELQQLSYLGPLRSYPPRHMAFTDREDPNWVAGGGRAWDRMRHDKDLRDKLNAWLGDDARLQTPYRLDLRRLVAPETAREALRAGLHEYVALMEERGMDGDAPEPSDAGGRLEDEEEFVRIVTRNLLDDLDVEGDADLVLVDKRNGTTVSHRDVGIGISQVLPVLVEAYGNEGRLVAIEQPEIHLHPRLQAELADVFLESALGERKNTFILETHSEHLILRVMRRIRETAEGRLPGGMAGVRPEDVAVLYVVPDPSGAHIVEIPITEDGEFGGPWPGGFFPERMKELY